MKGIHHKDGDPGNNHPSNLHVCEIGPNGYLDEETEEILGRVAIYYTAVGRESASPLRQKRALDDAAETMVALRARICGLVMLRYEEATTIRVEPTTTNALNLLRSIVAYWDSLDAVPLSEPAEPFKAKMDALVERARGLWRQRYDGPAQ